MTKTPDRARLAQIAARKLRELGISVELTESRRSLEGLLPDSGSVALPLVHPITQQPITNGRFVVEGHDQLRFLEPEALCSLQLVEFYSHMSIDSLLKSISSALHRRAQLVQAMHTRLEKLKIDVASREALDRVHATLEIPLTGVATMEARVDGLVLLQCAATAGGEAYSMGERSVDMDRFADAIEFELYLTPLIEKALGEKVALATTAQRPQEKKCASVAAQSAPPASLSLAWFFDKVGLDFFADSGLTLIRNLTIDDEPGRLELCFADRDHITGRVFASDGLRFEGEVGLSQLVRLDSFLTRALQRGVPRKIEQNEEDSSPLTEGLLPPAPSEIWVMEVRVEQETEEEVRYVSLDTNGHRHGAPRVLPRTAFQQIFLAQANSYRMLVCVLETSPNSVTYQRLDAERRATGNTREVPMTVFLSTFIAEAAAY